MSGLHLVAIDNRIVVESVDDNSPAKEMGIVSGDIIDRFEGQPVSQEAIVAVRKALSDPARTNLPLVLQRMGQELSLVLHLRERPWNSKSKANGEANASR
jgi:S1-C subfamily serine protease